MKFYKIWKLSGIFFRNYLKWENLKKFRVFKKLYVENSKKKCW